MENYAELMDALSETNEDRAKITEPTRPLNAVEYYIIFKLFPQQVFQLSCVSLTF